MFASTDEERDEHAHDELNVSGPIPYTELMEQVMNVTTYHCFMCDVQHLNMSFISITCNSELQTL